MAYLCRTLCALGAVAVIWAVVLFLTGGFVVEFGGLRISSRQPRNALLISLLCAVLISLLSFVPEARNTLRDDWSRWSASTKVWASHVAQVLAIAALPLTMAVAVGIDVHQWRAALPLWVDEEMIALNVRDRSVADLAGPLWLGQSAPFGWLALERMVMAVLGTGEHAIRAVPLLFGIATVGAAAWIGRRWMGRTAAMSLVLLCWLGPSLAHYRFEVKHYSADAFFGLLLPALAAWAIEAN
jgi:hypothetical protein